MFCIRPTFLDIPCSIFLFSAYVPPRPLHSFPTRRSSDLPLRPGLYKRPGPLKRPTQIPQGHIRSVEVCDGTGNWGHGRSEEHTSELQSRGHLVCRLLLEKKKEFIIEGEFWMR